MSYEVINHSGYQFCWSAAPPMTPRPIVQQKQITDVTPAAFMPWMVVSATFALLPSSAVLYGALYATFTPQVASCCSSAVVVGVYVYDSVCMIRPKTRVLD